MLIVAVIFLNQYELFGGGASGFLVMLRYKCSEMLAFIISGKKEREENVCIVFFTIMRDVLGEGKSI